MMIYSDISPAVVKTWAQLRGLAWGQDTTPPVTMGYLKSLTGKTQSALYEHMRTLRDTHALRWQMAEASTFIFSFPSNDEINSSFQEHASSLNSSLSLTVEESKENAPLFIPENRNIPEVQNKPKRKRASKVTVPAEVLRPIVDALAEVTHMDKSLNYGRLAKEAKDLHLAGYTPESVLAAYGEGGAWWQKDWRGRKNQPPQIGNIKPTIKALLNGNGGSHPDDVGHWTSDEWAKLSNRPPIPSEEVPF